MEFVDLKRTKADKEARKESYKVCEPGGEDDYPYGLRISLGSDELKKLGITTLPKAGAVLHLEAKAHVHSATESSRNGREEKSLELELREMMVGSEEDDAKEDAEETAARRTSGMRGAIDKALKGK